MGFGGISIAQLLIVLGIIILIFGTKKLRGLGRDLGGAVKGFKHAMNNEESTKKPAEETTIIDGKADTMENISAEAAEKKHETD